MLLKKKKKKIETMKCDTCVNFQTKNMSSHLSTCKTSEKKTLLPLMNGRETKEIKTEKQTENIRRWIKTKCLDNGTAVFDDTERRW